MFKMITASPKAVEEKLNKLEEELDPAKKIQVLKMVALTEHLNNEPYERISVLIKIVIRKGNG